MRNLVVTGLVAMAVVGVPASALATGPTPEVYSPQKPPQLEYVCNEAQSSWKGQSRVDSNDPNPPARRNHSSLNMPVGRGNGLVHAAENSPALALCGGARPE